MIGQLESSVVRILDATGAVAGAGFRVSDRHVLTCAHVVALALALRADSPDMPEAEVSLDFPLVAKGRTLRARTILWKPVSSGPSTSPSGAEDIAGLELVGQAPSPSRYCLTASPDLWGHGFRAFGFPAQRDDGVWATGVLRGRQGAGWIQIEDLKDVGYRVEPGFSGAPVWDEALDGVVGMAVATDEQPGVRAAFIIPTEGGPHSREAGPVPGLDDNTRPLIEVHKLDASDPHDARSPTARHVVLGIADRLPAPIRRLPSQWPATVRSAASWGRSSIIAMGWAGRPAGGRSRSAAAGSRWANHSPRSSLSIEGGGGGG